MKKISWLNPFVVHSPRLLEALIRSGHGWFLRQTYPRGLDPMDPALKAAFLLSHYPDPTQAMVHFEAIAQDPYRKIYAVEDSLQKQQLFTAVSQPTGFKVYSPLLPGQWKPGEILAGRIRHYLEHRLLWRPGRSESVQAKLFTQFGEVFLTLKCGSQEAKIPLRDLESTG